MNSYYHARSSASKWGGSPEDYLPVHEFIDSSKQIVGDVRHRSIYHHTLGVWLCELKFGKVLRIPKPPGGERLVPVRLVAERHVIEDLGWLPSPKDYIDQMVMAQWFGGGRTKTAALREFDLTRGIVSDE